MRPFLAVCALRSEYPRAQARLWRQRRTYLGCLAAAALALLAVACSRDGYTPKERAFAEHYLAAHERGDMEAMMKLHWLEGVTEQNHFLIRQAVMHELQYPVKALRFEAIEAGDHYRIESLEGLQVPNLEPVRRVVIAFDSPEKLHASFLLGEHTGRYYFVHARPAATEATGSPAEAR